MRQAGHCGQLASVRRHRRAEPLCTAKRKWLTPPAASGLREDRGPEPQRAAMADLPDRPEESLLRPPLGAVPAREAAAAEVVASERAQARVQRRQAQTN